MTAAFGTAQPSQNDPQGQIEALLKTGGVV